MSTTGPRRYNVPYRDKSGELGFSWRGTASSHEEAASRAKEALAVAWRALTGNRKRHGLSACAPEFGEDQWTSLKWTFLGKAASSVMEVAGKAQADMGLATSGHMLALMAALGDGPDDLPWPADNATWGGYGTLTIDAQRDKRHCVGLQLPDWGMAPATADAVMALTLPWAADQVARFDAVGIGMRTLRTPHPVERTHSATLRAVAWIGAKTGDSLSPPPALLRDLGADDTIRAVMAQARKRHAA